MTCIYFGLFLMYIYRFVILFIGRWQSLLFLIIIVQFYLFLNFLFDLDNNIFKKRLQGRVKMIQSICFVLICFFICFVHCQNLFVHIQKGINSVLQYMRVMLFWLQTNNCKIQQLFVVKTSWPSLQPRIREV